MKTSIIITLICILLVYNINTIVLVESCSAIHSDFVYTNSATNINVIKYNFTFDSQQQFMLIRVNNTDDVTVNAFHENVSVVTARVDRSGDCQYVILKPSTSGVYCGTSSLCQFRVEVKSKTSTQVWFQLEGYYGTMLRYGVVKRGNLTKLAHTYYGVEVVSKDLSVLIRLVPDEQYKWMDLDMRNMFESSPFSYFRPDGKVRNHYQNIREDTVVDGDEQGYADGLIISDVYAPRDTLYEKNFFSIYALQHYRIHEVLDFSFVGVVGAMMITVLCVFTTAAIVSRRRRERQLDRAINPYVAQVGGMRHEQEPRGVSQTEMQTCTRFVNYSAAITTTRCAICLIEYEEDATLRELPCKHVFHIMCVDEWLKHHRQCPLCQQDVAVARSMFNAVPSTTSVDQGAPDRDVPPSSVV